jgi:hypothetical protein
MYRYPCQILVNLELSRQIFEKSSNMKFLKKNPSSGSRVVPCGRKGGRIDGQTDMTNLIVALRNFANRPKELTFDPASIYGFLLPLFIYPSNIRTQ